MNSIKQTTIDQTSDQINQTKVPYFWSDSHIDTPDIRVAVYQCVSTPLTFAEALATLDSLGSQYGSKSNNQSRKPVDLIVFPELWLCGYDVHPSTIRDLSISLHGDKMKQICDVAAKHEIAFSFGYAERDEQISNRPIDDNFTGHLFNSSVTIDVDGNIANNYRKAHLWQDGVSTTHSRSTINPENHQLIITSIKQLIKQSHLFLSSQRSLRAPTLISNAQ